MIQYVILQHCHISRIATKVLLLSSFFPQFVITLPQLQEAYCWVESPTLYEFQLHISRLVSGIVNGKS